MLDPWITSRSRAKKAIARVAYEHTSWRRATAFHALTGREADDIARQSGRTDSLVIANAGPPVSPAVTRRPAPRVVYLGRIHPKKNLLALVEAWRQLDLRDGSELVIAGWGDPADEADLRAALVGGPLSARFIGPVYGAAKQGLLSTARFAIVPSLSEGLPMAVLEAWASGTPVLMSAACHLPDGFKTGAALDCGTTAAQIGATLNAALRLADQDWQAMSTAALALAAGPYSAAAIAARWGEAYAALMELRK